MDEETHVERTLWIIANEDGDITADTDRNDAIDRMNDLYGGEFLRNYQITVRIPRTPQIPVATITLPDEKPLQVTHEA